VGILTRDTALLAFAFLCAGWIVGIDVRPLVRQTWSKYREPAKVDSRSIRFDGIFPTLVDSAFRIEEIHYLRVRNCFGKNLQRCIAKVERIRSGEDAEFELQGALQTKARRDDPRPSRRFALDADEQKLMVLAYREQGPKGDVHKVATETDSFSIWPGKSCEVDLMASSEHGTPDRMTVKLSVDKDSELTCEILESA
jgi:hypothetical protein